MAVRSGVDSDGSASIANAARAIEGSRTTVAELVDGLVELGVETAYGVSGGAMAAFWHALSDSPIDVRHFRQESGAVFAAIESSFAADAPVAVFTTAGPGLTNALTGMLAARDEGARVVLVSAHSSAAQRGRLPIQETTADTLPAELFTSGGFFDFGCTVDDPAQLPTVLARVAAGFGRPEGFVAHVSLPTAVQNAPAPSRTRPSAPPSPAIARGEVVDECLRSLAGGRTLLWVGFGARRAANEVRELARVLGAPVISTPRGKGIFPESDSACLGVTGIGGHDVACERVAAYAPDHVLVLGSRLGEASTFEDPRLRPRARFVHVDIDPSVPGIAYPGTPVLAVCSEIGAFVRALLDGLAGGAPGRAASGDDAAFAEAAITSANDDVGSATLRDSAAAVRPTYLMEVLQRRVVDGSDATVLAECGNSFIWATHYLRFDEPARYRLSTGVGSMGHAAAGVVGAAAARGGRAVALVGDGAMLMSNEISTAVRHGTDALWIVLNDARYGMCAQGMDTLGLSADATIPEVDFARFARAQGAHGRRVAHEHELDEALEAMLATPGPGVLDVLVDPDCRPPSDNRNRGLGRQIAFPVTR